MKKKVIAAGHICLDITPIFPGKKVAHLTDILSPGKLLTVKEADVHTGGSVANTGLAMKILGADVTLMGKIGADAFGDMVRNALKKYDAEQGMLIAEGESTSYSVILAIPGVDRIFLHNTGANDTFCAADIPREALEEASLFHFGYPSVMKSMYEKDGEELVNMMGEAQELPIKAGNEMTIIMMAGLQGAGKTTTAAKLAGQLKSKGKRPLLVACDVYRPAAITQL